MAESIAAVGLASSIITFVDLAQKVISRLRDFSNDLKDSTNVLAQIQTHLPAIIDGLSRIQRRADSGELDEEAKNALTPIVLACHRQTEVLSGIMDKVIPASDASKWERRRKAIQSLTTDGEVKKASEALRHHLNVLVYHHVVGGARPGSVVKKAFWLVPFDRNPTFVGRDSLFDMINQNFTVSEGTQPKVALYGLGGIGKSQIALEFCFRERSRQPTCSVFWVNAATVARFEESFQRMAKEFGLNDRGDSQTDSLMLVKNWLETDLLDTWLMVIDNVDDKTAFFQKKCRNDKTPSQLLPHCPQGRLIFTSRTRDVAFDLSSPRIPICVDFLTTEEGLELLRKRLGPDPPEAQLIELLVELGHIPLAVTQAISFILKRRKSVDQYLEHYRKDDDSRSRLLSHEFLDHGRQDQTLDSVAKTWQISFQWIHEHHVKSAEILCLMAFYQHHSVPEQLLRCEGVDDFEFEDSIAILQAFSLLDVNTAGTRYSTHRLIQVTTQLWLKQNGSAQLETWALRALKLIALRFPPPDNAPANDYWENCQNLLPHAENLLHKSFNLAKQESDLDKAKLLIHTAGYIDWSEDNVGDVQRRFKRAFEIRESYLGLRHPDTLKSMGFHFWSLALLGYRLLPELDRQEAKVIGYRLLELRREVLGPRHPDIIEVSSHLAELLRHQGDFKDSEALQREALKLSEEVNGRLHIDTVNCMSFLAGLLQDMERFKEAVEIATESVRISTELLGPEHRTVLTAKSDLATFLGDEGKLDEAIGMHRDVMMLKEKVFGPDHPGTLVTAVNLAEFLAKLEKYEEALDGIGHVMSTIQVSRRNYGHVFETDELIRFKMDWETKLAAKQMHSQATEAPTP